MQKKNTHTIYLNPLLETLIKTHRENHIQPNGKPMALSHFLQLAAQHYLAANGSIVTMHLPGGATDTRSTNSFET